MLLLHCSTQLLRRMKPCICQNLAKMKLLFMIVVYGMTSGAAFAADYATVLMYHRFGEDKYPSTNIRIEQFEAHLDVLGNGDYTIWPLGKIVDHLQQGLDLPTRPSPSPLMMPIYRFLRGQTAAESSQFSLYCICSHPAS